MNKLACFFLAFALLLLMTGCGSLMNPVPKNVVMVKRIEENNKNNEIAMPRGVLAVESTKSLGLNALEKYFGVRLSADQAQFEVKVVDINALKGLVEQNIQSDERKDAEAMLKEVPEGLFYLTITSTSNQRYELVLNAGTGGVLKISNPNQANGLSDLKTIELDSSTIDKFLQEKQGLKSEELEQVEKMVFENREVTYAYRNLKDDRVRYVIEEDLKENRITGFSKDIMALLTWTAKLKNGYPK
ncbi:hypothetical protein [Paenibacillus sp. ATY16]|uniref:hypothetical protein n=1 Tax=Paenibacillus sp. ATY16 TaxID=1759312 RepID=UPI0020102EF9|nr:hypothetical protein [Paenibacillus sp. ATY16]MCK9862449.1 hypothetical protein [Paenibacillus sp. ATY16]